MLMDSVRFIIMKYDSVHGQYQIQDIIEVGAYTKHWNWASKSLGDWLAHLHNLYADDGGIHFATDTRLNSRVPMYKIELQFVDSKHRTRVQSKVWTCLNRDGVLPCEYVQQTDPAHDHCVHCAMPEERK